MARFFALVTAVLAAATIVSGQVTTFTGGVAGPATYSEGTPILAGTINGGTYIGSGTTLYYVDTTNHQIRQVTAAGVNTVLAGSGSTGGTDGTGTAAVFASPYGICSDGTNLFVADTGNNVIRKVTTAGVVTTAFGTLAAGTGTTDSATAASVKFSGPKGCTFIGTTLYVADTGNNGIRVVPSGSTSGEIGASTLGATAADAITGAAVWFSAPVGVCNDGTNLYVVDTGNNKIKKVTSPGVGAGTGSLLLGQTTAGFVDSATTTTVQFNGPQGCVVSGTTTIYIADTSNHAIRSYALAGGTTTSTPFGGQPTTAASGDSLGTAAVPNTASRLTSPAGVTLNSAATSLVIFDSGNKRIKTATVSSGALALTVDQSFLSNPTQTVTNPAGVCSDSTNYYIVDRGNHVVRKIVKTTGVSSVLAGTQGTSGDADGTGTAAKFNSPWGCSSDATNLWVSDTNNNKIRKIVISSGAVTTFIGPAAGTTTSGDAVGSPSSSINPTALINAPRGITVIGTSNLYFADTGNNKVKSVTLTGTVGTVAVLAGAAFGTASLGDVDGTGAAARFNNPVGLCTDATDLYVVDQGNNKIRKITVSSGASAVFSGAAAGTNSSADTIGANAAATGWNAPTECAFSTSLYVTDSGNNKIKKVTTGGVSTIFSGAAAGTTTAGNVDNAYSATLPTFWSPAGVSANAADDLLVADAGNNRIRRVTATGTQPFSGVFNNAGYANGNAAATLFSGPSDAVVFGGNLYVSDATNNVVRKIDGTGTSTLFAGTANSAGSTDGAAGTGKLTTPAGLCTDGTNLFIVDSGTHTIRMATSAGVLSTIAGTSGTSGQADGTGTAAKFNAPTGCWSNGTSLWIADSGNNVIRQIASGATLATTAVTSTPFGAATSATSGDVLGTAAVPNTGAKFNAPSGIFGYTTGGFSYLVIADKSNNKIKLLNITTGAVTILAGPAAGTTTSGDADGTGSAAAFSAPSDVVVDQAGNIFVADSGNNKIKQVTWAGVSKVYAGAAAGTNAIGIANVATTTSPYTAARFNNPSNLALNQTTLFVVEAGNSDVRAIAFATVFTTATTTVTNTTTTTVTNTTTTSNTTTTTATVTTTASNGTTNTTTSSPTTTAATKSSNAVVAAATAVAIAVLAILA